MKLGTQLEHVIRIILRYRAITDLTSDLCGSIFFQISDKIINFQSLILLICHFLIAHSKNISKGLFLSQKVRPLTYAAVFSSKFSIRSLIFNQLYCSYVFFKLYKVKIFPEKICVDKKFDLCGKFSSKILIFSISHTAHMSFC